jgi:hypothetical protein
MKDRSEGEKTLEVGAEVEDWGMNRCRNDRKGDKVEQETGNNMKLGSTAEEE